MFPVYGGTLQKNASQWNGSESRIETNGRTSSAVVVVVIVADAVVVARAICEAFPEDGRTTVRVRGSLSSLLSLPVLSPFHFHLF